MSAASVRTPTPHVRAQSQVVRSLLDDAARLPTTAALIHRLDSSDQFVYVAFTDSPAIPRARTKFVTATATARFLRIAINAHVVPGTDCRCWHTNYSTQSNSRLRRQYATTIA
jgi:hypothetical protein